MTTEDVKPITSDWIESMVKTIQLVHRTLIIFSIIVMGMYSQPPPSIESYDGLEENLATLLEHEDKKWPTTTDWPYMVKYYVGDSETGRGFTLFGETQSYSFNWNPGLQQHDANSYRGVGLCYRDSNGDAKIAEEVATATHRAQFLRSPLEARISEYEKGAVHGLSSDYDAGWTQYCEKTLEVFKQKSKSPPVSTSCRADVHCNAEGATVTVTPQAQCGDFDMPCWRTLSQVTFAQKVFKYNWVQMESERLMNPERYDNSEDFDVLISDIRSSVHYPEIRGMTTESALSHVRQMRAQLIAGWSMANKTAMSIPTPSRSMVSFILAALCLYVITCAAVIVIRIRRNRPAFQPDISAVTWIGLAGNGFPTAMTAVVTGLLPWLALESSIRHEATAIELAGALSSTTWTQERGLLPVLEGMGPDSSAIMVSFLAVLAALSIVLLRLALRQPRNTSSSPGSPDPHS